ncbi:hypothetical protein CEXT_226211 [Caerostris extrusa]|uniref:Uncharacterized protein n=1 Tax=Caerostris extrusa TaxID=172846 RepID=A0AAV4QFQ6_CAEEX|nr:hypothetical protein CEXT_226211 [Caerostris extrusa]
MRDYEINISQQKHWLRCTKLSQQQCLLRCTSSRRVDRRPKVVAVQKQLSVEKIKLINDPPLRPSTFTELASSAIPSYDVYSIADKLAEAKHVMRLGDGGMKAKSNEKIVKKIEFQI